MRRTRILPAIIGALALVVLVAAAALVSRPIGIATSETSAGATGAEAGPPEVAWVFFSQLPPGGGPGTFMVQAGLFGEPRPRVDVEVPWAVDTAVDIARTPAVARPAAGAVVYAADDGETSTIQRVAIERGATPQAVAEVDDAVWSIAAAPDGSVAYLACGHSRAAGGRSRRRSRCPGWVRCRRADPCRRLRQEPDRGRSAWSAVAPFSGHPRHQRRRPVPRADGMPRSGRVRATSLIELASKETSASWRT